MKIRIVLITLIMARIFIVPANASEQYIFDKAHSRIFFEVNHLGFSDFNGMFRKFDGSIYFDEKKIENSKVDVTIDIASVDSYDVDLNAHLLNEDFFDVGKYPEARFVSKKVEKIEKNRIKVLGELTLKGITKPLTLDVKFNKVGLHPYYKKQTAGFSASAVFDRTEFGIAYGVPGVGKNINLEIDVEAHREEKNTQQGKE